MVMKSVHDNNKKCALEIILLLLFRKISTILIANFSRIIVLKIYVLI